MSHNASRWVWDQLDITGSAKLVLLRLADHADPSGGSVRPGIASVAEYTGLSPRQVARYIKSFVESGILVIEKNAQGGRGKIPEYMFAHLKEDTHDAQRSRTRKADAPVKGDTHDAKRASLASPLRQIKGDIEGGKRVTSTTVKGDIHARTYREPSRTVTKPSLQRPEKKPLPTNGPAQQIVAVFCEAVGIERPVNYGRAVGHAQQLVNAGMTAEEIPALVGWLRGQAWIKDGFDLGTAVTQADKWLQSRDTTRSSGPPGVALLDGERVEQLGPTSWNLHGRDGRVRKVRPEYFGVVWDERRHINDGAAAFYAAVAAAKHRQEGT